MEIRALNEHDAEAWWHLRREALASEPFAFGQSLAEHERTTIDCAAAHLREMRGDCFTVGAFEREALIAMATFIRDCDDKRRHKGRIFGVYVGAGHKGRGLGSALMRATIDKATADPSLEQILLTVTAGSEVASRLYLKLGFEFYGTEPRALKVDEVYADMHHMVLRVR